MENCSEKEVKSVMFGKHSRNIHAKVKDRNRMSKWENKEKAKEAVVKKRMSCIEPEMKNIVKKQTHSSADRHSH